MTRLPDFLVIGAMKSGTTSLYEDLLTQPYIFLPPGEKEPDALVDDRVLTPTGRAEYTRLYQQADAEQLCGDASTAYTKRPDIPGVAQRARRVLGAHLKAIYIVREPISRTISQHYHELARGELTGTLDDAVHHHPRLIDYSRYAYQLRSWLDVFGMDRVRVARFEDYIADRPRNIASLSRFLGVEPRPELVARSTVFGRTMERTVPRGAVWRISRTRLYRKSLRQLIPAGTRDWLRKTLLPKPPPPPPPPREETLRYLAERFQPEVEQLQRLLGWSEPLWDLERAILTHLEAGEEMGGPTGKLPSTGHRARP